MASPTPTPNATINAATQGTVVFVQGEAYLRDRQGKLIAIKPGDAVVEGQEIVTAAGAVVELQLPSGARLSIGADRQVLLNDELFATATPDPSENIVSSLGADADRVIQALNAGRDPFADLEEPAAGLTAGANGDQTHDFVRLVRILEDVTPLAFEYSSSTDGIDFRPVSGATALPTTTPLPANRPPVASDDTGASTLAGQAVRVNVLDNDPDGDPLTVTDASVDPAQGRVFVNADGTLTFTPADNFGGTAQITYTISDGKGGTSSAAASVAVTPANTPAQLSSARASVQEDSVLSAAGTLTISDPDAGEATFQPQTHIAGSYGHFSIDATGAWSYTLDNASPAVQALKDGPPQTETFTVYSADGTATTVTIDVFGKDEPANTPAQLSSARASVQEDSVLSAAGTLTISDPDAGEATFQPQTHIAGSYGHFSIDATGAWSYTLDNASPAVQALKDGPPQTETFTVYSADGTATTVTIDVFGKDEPANTPAQLSSARASVQEDSVLSAAGTLTISDPDAGEATFQPQTHIAGSYGHFSIDATGAWSYTLDNASPAVQALKDGPPQTETFTVYSADGTATTVTIDVFGKDEPANTPAQLSSARASVQEDSVLSAAGTLTISDPDAGEATFQPQTHIAGSYGHFSIDTTGAWSYTLDNASPAVQALKDGPPQTETFTVYSADGTATTVTIDVFGKDEPANTPAQLSSARASVQEDSVLSAAGTLTISDPDAGEATFQPQTHIAGSYGHFSIDTTGAWSYTLDNASPAVQALKDGPPQTETFTVYSADGTATTVTIDVFGKDEPANTPAQLSSARASVQEDSVLSAAGTLTISDPDAGEATFQPQTHIAGSYGHFSIDATGAWSYTLDNASPAVQALKDGPPQTETFTVYSADGTATTVTIDVFGKDEPANTPAQLSSARASVQEDSVLSAAGTLTISDPDAGEATFQPQTHIAGSYGHFSIDATGAWSYTLDNASPAVQALKDGPPQTETFTVYSADGTATTVTIDVFGKDEPPTANDDHGAVTEGGTLNVLAANGLIASALNPAGKDYDVDGDKLTIVGIRTGGKTGTGLSENVDTTVVGAHGKLVVHPDGSYTYIATDTTLRAGEVVTDTFTYTVSDGKASALAELVITVTGIDVNLPPVVTATSTNVSEEGLPGGEPDTLGTIDKTNSATSSGVISISDADGGPISVTLSAPTTTLTSGGTPLSWTGDGTQTLVGSAGGVDILRITVGNDGRYTVNLLGPVDHPNTSGEDALTVDFGVKVSDGIAITPSTLSVTIEDDAPQASATTQVIEIAPTDTNLLIVLDTSGSMVFPGMTGANRLETARAALLQLFDSYDSFGEVRIRLVTFSDVATARGTGWLTVSEANAELGKLTPSGGTHYDKAIETAKTAFTTIGKLSTGQNITYFMSDGGPSPGRDLTPTKEASWKSFLETNQMTSFALGMGSGAVKSALDPVAYDGATKTDLDGQVITELNELTGALLATVVTPATGEIFSGGTTGFGADGGHIQSIIVDGVTYAPDDTLSTLVVTGGGSHATYDATSHEITVQTAKGGTLKLDFDTGRYSYTPTAANGADSFQYVLNDRDGDSAGSQVTFLTTNAGTSQSISGGAHSDIISGGSGNDIISGGAGNDTLTGGLGSDTFKWSLTDAGVAGAPAVDVVKDFNPATPASGGDVLDLRDLLVGENSSNLGNYLHFEKSGADTVLNISTTGGYASSFNAGATDQKVVLQGVDLTTLGTDTQIIQNLLTNGKLHTD